MSTGRNAANQIAPGFLPASAKKNARRSLRMRADRRVHTQMTPRFEIPQPATDRTGRSLNYNKFRIPSVSKLLTGSAHHIVRNHVLKGSLVL